MPLLGPDDPLPARPRRVLVAGTSGSGKTTLAARIAEILGVAHVEIDGLFHGPDWTPRASFVAEVEAFSAGPEWVTEWQYGAVRDRLVRRADLLVWLDLPRPVVMRQVVGRTVRRRLRRTPLWHGNVEPPLRTFLTDPQHIVRWAWATHGRTGPRVVSAMAADPRLVVVRLRSRRAAGRWVAGPLRRANGPAADRFPADPLGKGPAGPEPTRSLGAAMTQRDVTPDDVAAAMATSSEVITTGRDDADDPRGGDASPPPVAGARSEYVDLPDAGRDPVGSASGADGDTAAREEQQEHGGP